MLNQKVYEFKNLVLLCQYANETFNGVKEEFNQCKKEKEVCRDKDEQQVYELNNLVLRYQYANENCQHNCVINLKEYIYDEVLSLCSKRK